MLQEKTAAPGGRHIEVLGSYDPHSKKAILKDERIKYWISKGAQASDTVWNLLVSKSVISGKKRVVKIPAKEVETQKDAEVKQNDTEKKPEENKFEEVKEVKAEEVNPPAVGEEKPAETPKEEVKADEKPAEEAKAE
jgi:small subunit ribosomal protein S16